MKKIGIILAIIMMGLSLNMKAQTTSLDEAVDFTVTDCHGTEINLFEILDRGQAVLIDFFFYTCSGCRQIAPYISGAYTEMGCNMHDVFFMEISDIDNNAMCLQWCDEFNVEFPTVGRDGGGAEVHSLYGITACPTVILIMPDRSIPIKGYPPMYPFSVGEVVQLLGQYGNLQPHDCSGLLVDSPDEVQTLGVYPNPASEVLTITGIESLESVSVFNILGQKMDEFQTSESVFPISTANYPDGTYFVKIGQGQSKSFVILH